MDSRTSMLQFLSDSKSASLSDVKKSNAADQFSQKLRPIGPYKPTNKINFATRLTNGELKVEAMSPAVLSVRTGQNFVWTDTMLISDKTKLKFSQTLLPHDAKALDLKAIEEKLNEVHENQKKLAIIKVNDVVGYGVIALEDIPAQSFISLYAGECVLAEDHDRKSEYLLETGFKENGRDIGSIDAKKYRNFAGFFSHAFPLKKNAQFYSPHEPNMDNIRINYWDPNDVVTLNLCHQEHITYNHVPFPFFVNPEKINAGSLLTINYGIGYWEDREVSPCFMSLKGEIIPLQVFTTTHNRLNNLFHKSFKLLSEIKDKEISSPQEQASKTILNQEIKSKKTEQPESLLANSNLTLFSSLNNKDQQAQVDVQKEKEKNIETYCGCTIL